MLTVQPFGIPYTAPPVGDLRWAPPAPVIPWNGVLDASSPGPVCTQRKGASGVAFYDPPPDKPIPEQNEDCLTLNVWSKATRTDETSVPVDHLATIMGTGVKGFNRFTASMLPGIRDEIPTYYPAATDEQAMQSWRDCSII